MEEHNKIELRLDSIEKEIKHVEYLLHERLVEQKRTLFASSFAMVWLGKTIRKEGSESLLNHMKQMKLWLGDHKYKTAEQGESLTRVLYELDDVHCGGDSKLKERRKKLVIHIQDLVSEVDDRVVSCESNIKYLLKFFDPLITEFESICKRNMEVEEKDEKEVEMEDTTSVERDENNEQFEDEDMVDMNQIDESTHMIDREAEDEDKDKDEEGSLDMQHKGEEKGNMDNIFFPVNKLPIWYPRYQLKEGRENLYLEVELPGIDEENVSVSMLRDGTLQISGFKQPNYDQLDGYRTYDSQPSFGRFLIRKRFPLESIDTSAVKCLLEDGVLFVSIPKQFQRRSYHSFPSRMWPSYGLAW